MANTIVYWRGSAEIRTELIQAFSNEGEQVTTVRSLEEVLDLMPKQTIQMLIVDGSAGEREASARVVELSTTAKLHPIPVMFISVQATKRAAVLKNQYKTLLPIDLPFKVEDVLEQAASVLAKRSAEQKPAAGRAASAKAAQAAAVETADKPAPSSFNASLLSRASTLDDLDDDFLITDGIKKSAIKGALNRITETDSWLGLHARRVALLAGNITQALRATADRDSAIRTAGLFLNWGILEDWGLLENFNNLRRMDIFLCLDREAIDALGRGFERSAGFVAERLKDEPVKDLLETVSMMIRGQEPNISPELHRDAQCVMVSEFINRSCWGNGAWNSFGAYRSIKHLRSGMLRNVDTVIVDAAIRALGDAIQASSTMTNSFSLTDEQKAEASKTYQDARQKAQKQFPDSETTALSITALEPGQRVARPIAARDGQIVLDANVELDRDHIWRLWQLGAVRALNSTVHVVKVRGRR